MILNIVLIVIIVILVAIIVRNGIIHDKLLNVVRKYTDKYIVIMTDTLELTVSNRKLHAEVIKLRAHISKLEAEIPSPIKTDSINS